MSALAPRRYRFATPAQWEACLFDGVDRAAIGTGVQPAAPYGQEARLLASPGAHAPVLARDGALLWRDDDGCLHRFGTGDDAPCVGAAPGPLARAQRIVALANGLWVIDAARGALVRYEAASLARLQVVPIPDVRLIDIAGAGPCTLFVLAERGDATQVLDTARPALTLDGIARATACVFLRETQRFVVMTAEARPRLCWFGPAGGAPVHSVIISALHPCFQATALGCDGRGRVFVAGQDGAGFGGQPYVLVLDGEGSLQGELVLDLRDAPLTGVTGRRGAVYVAGARGLLRFARAQRVPGGVSEVRCTLITPALRAPGSDDRRWLRIEAHAHLPAGATLTMSYAAMSEDALHQRLAAVADDTTVPASLRAQTLLREPGLWSAPMVFHGGTEARCAAPLFDVDAPAIRVCITLSATAGGALPALHELAVLYAGPTLMAYLPAIYRREGGEPGSFLRRFVGVLESTTQDLDGRIGALPGQVHPDSATGPWRDFVASWLGLPWDAALEDGQKQRLLGRAADLAQGRGTRAGLETLLDCLVPGTPRRFRVIDAGADLGFATVGGTLPALLGGRTPWRSELDVSKVLGHTRLCGAGQPDDGARHLAGWVHVDVAASPDERRAWAPWLASLIGAMVPLTVRVQLRWLPAGALQGTRLGTALVLAAAPPAQLGDAVLGVARLPERGSRIDSLGADIGTRLE